MPVVFREPRPLINYKLFTKEVLQKAMSDADGDVQQAARNLGLYKERFRHLLKTNGIVYDEKRAFFTCMRCKKRVDKKPGVYLYKKNVGYVCKNHGGVNEENEESDLCR